MRGTDGAPPRHACGHKLSLFVPAPMRAKKKNQSWVEIAHPTATGPSKTRGTVASAHSTNAYAINMRCVSKHYLALLASNGVISTFGMLT